MSNLKNIEDYLTDPGYVELYTEYRESGDPDISFTLLEYFTILSDLMQYTRENSINPLATWKYISDLNIDKDNYFFLIPGYLYLLKRAAGNPTDQNYDSKLDACHRLFSTEHQYERIAYYPANSDPAGKFDPNAPLTFQLTNNFDHIDPQKVFEHFRKGLVDKGHCDLLVLGDYLVHAFEEQKPPAEKFRLNKIDSRKKIMKLFHDYFVLADKPFGKATAYAGLLGDYFDGFDTENVRTNFSKGSY